MLSDVRASEMISKFDSVQAVALSNGIQSSDAQLDSSCSNPTGHEDSGVANKNSIGTDEVMLSLKESRTANLYSLALTLVDYAGSRILCQTTIPGMLSGELSLRPSYGAASLCDPFLVDPVSETLLQKFIQKPLGLKCHAFKDCTGKQVRNLEVLVGNQWSIKDLRK